MPETPLVGVKDLADARAEEAKEETTAAEEDDESRYTTVDQALHAFGDDDIFELAGVSGSGEDSSPEQ